MSALRVLYLDNHLLACAKPAGVAVVPDASGDESLLEQAREWVRVEMRKPGRAYLGVVHRLDRPVSGVVLFARTSKAAARLSASFREGDARKVYWAVVEGEVGGATGVGRGAGAGAGAGVGGEISQWLVKDERANVVRVVAEGGSAGAREVEGARLATTRWRVLERVGGRALVELEPETGRPHQLRVAMASLGAPIVGDVKYGARVGLPDRSVALHALELEVTHPTRREERVRIDAGAPRGEWWGVFAVVRERAAG